MVSNKVNIVRCSPRGWWYNDGRVVDQWSGPFDTAEEAEKMGSSLAPDKVKFITLINLQLWEKREVRITDPEKKYKKCTNCRGGFVGDRCCSKCEGTGRIEA